MKKLDFVCFVVIMVICISVIGWFMRDRIAEPFLELKYRITGEAPPAPDA